MPYAKFDPTSDFFKTIVGAVPENQDFSLRIQIDSCINPQSVSVCIYNDDKSFDNQFELTKDLSCDGFDNFVVTLNLPKGLYWYFFKMQGVPYEQYIGINQDKQAQLFFENVVPWQLSVYKKVYQTPTWLNDGIMYHIMVDRFFSCGKTELFEDKILRKWGEQPYFQEADGTVKNRDFFGGNLKGILQKLPYLKSLNVTTIYLSPIFSAYSNHKYDTEDFEAIDPSFGTIQDFENLCKEAKKHNINVILDGVFNHVGSGSKYFNLDKKFGEGGAYHDKNSPYRQWFVFKDNNQYECWWNFRTLPRLNATNKSLQKYLTGKEGIVPLWISRGAFGWRLDVVDELDNCMLDAIVGSAKNQNPQCAIIGEVWEDASNKIAYGQRRRYFEGNQLDSVMNYPLRTAIVQFVRDRDVNLLKNVVFDTLNNYPLDVRNNLMNILGTHDTVRILTNLAGERLENDTKEKMSRTFLTEQQYIEGIKLLKLCAVLQYTFFGFPSVFYGDEAGVEGYKDPFCRSCFPWGKENKQLVDFYTRLGEIRKNPALQDGNFLLLHASDGVFAFERQHTQTDQKIVVAVNRSHDEFCLPLVGNYVDLLTNRHYTHQLPLQPDQAVILVNQ